ncbi:MAG: hypothetical protein CBE24_06520 [bacterium TMED264]|nr:MAG: hypothetical protein CBE24_06520 [bacterium TMED264]
MKKRVSNGFTMIEIVLVIVIAGIIGSMAANLLYQGAEVYVGETNRQGFVSEARSAFWRLMRTTQGQKSPDNFVSSSSSQLNLKNAKNDSIVFQAASSGDLKISLDGGSNYNLLSKSIQYSSSNGFSFYNSSFNIITPSQGGLNNTEAGNVYLPKLDFIFVQNKDTLTLSSYVYPMNFRFGKKMSYHN